MKKLHKLAAAVAVAAGIALSPQANAVIELESNGVGDALLFPAFNGYIENYFTISNHSDLWVQGHIRFRGAAWSAELRDFDVILSPGDVFVFRLADLDGDGQWEIDENLDTKNFQYTGMVHTCQTASGATVANCLDASNLLEPTVNERVGITQALIEHQRHVGYVEFIGEAVLNHMSHEVMNALISTAPGNWASYVTTNGNARGTSAWKWSAAQRGFVQATTQLDNLAYPGGKGGEISLSAITNPSTHVNLGLSDVGNVLSGTAFVTIPGQTHGLAYNAEAFTNFRTGTAFNSHRIENYRLTVDQLAGTDRDGVLLRANAASAVIVHDENASSDPAPAVTTTTDGTTKVVTVTSAKSPYGDYIYGCPDGGTTNTDELGDELVISFNNTWGPTLADGDDHLGTPNDNWDTKRSSATYGPNYTRVGNVVSYHNSTTNSIDEVEAAIARAGTDFYSYYFDNDTFDKSSSGGKATLKSYFFGYFPTKYFYGENITTARQSASCQTFIDYTVGLLVNLAKPISVLVMDTQENPCTSSDTAISPARPKPNNKVLGQELNIFDIGFLKAGANSSAGCAGFKSGRSQITPTAGSGLSTSPNGFPGLFYTFEIGSDSAISQWRPMQR
jgi:hypothetical protein